jgi:hypothetical protein
MATQVVVDDLAVPALSDPIGLDPSVEEQSGRGNKFTCGQAAASDSEFVKSVSLSLAAAVGAAAARGRSRGEAYAQAALREYK